MGAWARAHAWVAAAAGAGCLCHANNSTRTPAQGLRWMVGLTQHGLNGILADECAAPRARLLNRTRSCLQARCGPCCLRAHLPPQPPPTPPPAPRRMGLGKTVQVIAMVCHLVEAEGPAPPFLIAAPASVLPNWAAELAAWAPALRVVQYKVGARAGAPLGGIHARCWAAGPSCCAAPCLRGSVYARTSVGGDVCRHEHAPRHPPHRGVRRSARRCTSSRCALRRVGPLEGGAVPYPRARRRPNKAAAAAHLAPVTPRPAGLVN